MEGRLAGYQSAVWLEYVYEQVCSPLSGRVLDETGLEGEAGTKPSVDPQHQYYRGREPVSIIIRRIVLSWNSGQTFEYQKMAVCTFLGPPTPTSA